MKKVRQMLPLKRGVPRMEGEWGGWGPRCILCVHKMHYVSWDSRPDRAEKIFGILHGKCYWQTAFPTPEKGFFSAYSK